jgi:rRNA-processing protein FCF1
MSEALCADCLIKITKAGLKELVCSNIIVYIPGVVKKEVVDAGKEKGCQDAYIVEDNIKSDLVKIVKSSSKYDNGDEALLALFNNKDYYAVATDDAKLVRHLKMKGIPFILPGLLIYNLMKNNLIKETQAQTALRQLSEFISEDEYSTVSLLMEKLK